MENIKELISEQTAERLADELQYNEESAQAIIDKLDDLDYFYKESMKNLLGMQASANAWMKAINKMLNLLFIIAVSTIVLVVFAKPAAAETTVTPFLSVGAYHKICATSSAMHCTDEAGSDTPGTIDLGVRIEPDDSQWWLLYADEIDVLIHHQSYVDRGWVIPDVIDFGGKEAYIDMVGMRVTWMFESFKFSF